MIVVLVMPRAKNFSRSLKRRSMQALTKTRLPSPPRMTTDPEVFRLDMQLDDPADQQIRAMLDELEKATSADDMYVLFIGGYYENSDCSAL